MAKTSSMTGKENHDASSEKRSNICDHSGVTWSDLNYDLLSLIMMQVGVVDFPAFSGVCKSWRSFVLSNKNKYMKSKPPMSIYISTTESDEKGYYCYLEEFERKSYKTILPHSVGRICLGLSCDNYLILFGRKTNDFWLVDPIQKKGLHFPGIPLSVSDDPKRIKAILGFSPSLYGCLFVMTHDSTDIWFSISRQGTWNHVSSTFPFVDITVFKGKIYTRNNAGHLCELKLEPKPELMLLETKNFINFSTSQHLVTSHESLFLMEYLSAVSFSFHRLDFDEMNWVLCEKTRKDYASISSKLQRRATVKHEEGSILLCRQGLHHKLKHMICKVV